MASVNLTCTNCTADSPCASCRAIARALRSAGHSVTRTSRYDTLRAATVGTYGFDACILQLAAHETPILDSATSLLARTRAAFVVEPGALEHVKAPPGFTIIPAADWQNESFPTEWIAKPLPNDLTEAASEDEQTTQVEPRLLPLEQFGSARRRLKSLAARAQRELGAAGFGDDLRLDPLAVLEDEISWASASASAFGLVMIVVPRKSAVASLHVESALAGLRELARTVVRSGDAIAQGSDSLLVILPEADEKQTALVATRLANKIRRARKGAASQKTLARAYRRVTVGTSVFPTHGLTRETLLARAAASAKPLPDRGRD